MSPKFQKTILTLTLLLLSGCSVQIQNEITATPSSFIITATLPASLTPPPSETPSPPPPPPTIAPVQGTTSTQLNVRSEPSTVGEVLGIIPANAIVQIVGKDAGENWWQILYEAGAEGKGWVTAQYVQTAGSPEVPVIGGGEAVSSSGKSAVVIQQLNIRSGPGTDFNSLGILNPNDVVSLTGKNRDGSWLQMEFASGPEGRGWVNAGFVKADQTDDLPIVAESGEVVGTGTPADTPPPPTPTVVPAPPDFDHPEAPLKTVNLEDAGDHTVLYNGDVSAPEGDTEDWIAVMPFDNAAYIGIQCPGSHSLSAEIVGTQITLQCNAPLQKIQSQDNAKFLIHVQANSRAGQLEYVSYILTIKSRP